MIPFLKIEATGNDFIVFDSRTLSLKRLTPSVIRRLCHRHLGIGADGVIFVGVQENSPLRMFYFNADGSAGEMCGNGLRAAARYAREEGLFPAASKPVIEAQDGLHAVRFNKDGTISVEILVSTGQGAQPDLSRLPLPENVHLLGFLNSGVPHLILQSEEAVEHLPLAEFAPALRHHPVFPAGTNVDVIQRLSANRVHVRTYERGVEAETLSCGTGVTAAALLLWQYDKSLPEELLMETRGGLLKVSRQRGRIVLTGPATLVFAGKIHL